MDKTYVPDEVCLCRVWAQSIVFPFCASGAVDVSDLLCILLYEDNFAYVGYHKTDAWYILHLSNASVPDCPGVPDLTGLLADSSWNGATQSAHLTLNAQARVIKLD